MPPHRNAKTAKAQANKRKSERSAGTEIPDNKMAKVNKTKATNADQEKKAKEQVKSPKHHKRLIKMQKRGKVML